MENYQSLKRDLESLEQSSNTFNIIEAIGMERQEIKHSKALASLLRPINETPTPKHLLKAFIKEFLSPEELEDINLEKLQSSMVECEENHIDILIKNEEQKFIILIENKIDACETGDQLTRYIRDIQSDESNYSMNEYRHFYLYLTITGEEVPYKEGKEYQYRSQWKPISHKRIVKNVLKKFKPVDKHDINILVKHYINLMEAKILENNLNQKQINEIYSKHKNALNDILNAMELKNINENAVGYLQRKIKENTPLNIFTAGTYTRLTFNSWAELNISGSNKYRKYGKKYMPVALEIVNNPHERNNEIFVKLVAPIAEDHPHRDAIRDELLHTFSNCESSHTCPSEKLYYTLWEHEKPFPKLNVKDVHQNGYAQDVDKWWNDLWENQLKDMEKKVIDIFNKYI